MQRISRSHIEADYKCHHYRYLQYHFNGKGIVPKKGRVELEAGTLVHSSLSNILEWCRTHNHKMPPNEVVRKSLRDAAAAFEEACLVKSIPSDGGRMMALTEGLVRAWCKVRLPMILANYEILDLEQEGLVDLTPEVIQWMTRLDGVLRRREDNEISALEFKTTGFNKPEYIASWQFDMQCRTHLLAIGDKFGGRGNSVLLEFLYKGYKKGDVIYSPLLLGYRKLVDGIYGSEEELDWRYEVVDQYGKTHRKGKEWQKFNVWEQNFQRQLPDMSAMEYWVDHVLDMDALRGCLLNIEVQRDEEALEEWFEQTQERELVILEGLHEVEMLKDNPEAQRRVLLRYFPRCKGKECKYNKFSQECEYFPLCFKQVPFENWRDLYVEREPHHTEEFLEEGGKND